IGGNSVLNSVNGGDINIGSVGNINLAGTTLFTTQADSFSSVNLISANNIQLINDSLVSVGSLNINADLVLSNDLLIQSTSANVSHTGSIDGFVNLTVSTNNNIEFSASDIGQVTPLNTVNMTAEVINAGKINALNGITMESTLGNIVFDQLNSQSEINLTSAGSISSNTYINTSGYTDISSDVLITNSIDGVFGLNGDLFTSVNDYSAINTGIGGILISNIGTITLSGIEILDGDILINATGSINQTGDIIIQQGTNNLTLTAGDEITMFEPAKSVISHGNIIYQALNTITISELTITGGDGIENDNILIETDLGDIATTNVGISLNEPDVTANVVSFVAENGSLGVGAQQFVINADKLVTIATVFSNQPFYVVAPENGVIDSSTVVSPTDASSLLGGDQRTQFSDLSAVDPTIFTEVRNFEEDETAILLPEDQLYTSKL
ncbi:MAG: hypothetical protein KAQ67_11305, partial [Gammaproteobacteria bacterium]|nr:hypothetical protein [Gammaproteobacteria bacterium]